jgi:hypothetical protein
MDFYTDAAQTQQASEANPFLRGDLVYEALGKIAKDREYLITVDEFLGSFYNSLIDISETDTTSLCVDKQALITLLQPGDSAPYLHISFIPRIMDLTSTTPPVSKVPVSWSASMKEQVSIAWLKTYSHAIFIPYNDLVAYTTQTPGFSKQDAIDILNSISVGNDRRESGKASTLVLNPVEIKSSTEVNDFTEPGLTQYTMLQKRPPGDFFKVELIAPSGTPGGIERHNIATATGEEVTSLILNMSPNSLVVNSAKKVNRVQSFTRWVEEHWGDEIDQISFSGNTFAFITEDYGLAVVNRDTSSPYKELQHLVNIYLLNGAVYHKEEDSTQDRRMFWDYTSVGKASMTINRHPRAGLISMRLYIKLSCDFAQFVGYFESFDITEDAVNPYRMAYTVSFKSEYTKWL